MYIIVNKDIKLSPGKLAAQVAHSAVKAFYGGEHNGTIGTMLWFRGSYTKIILKASQYELEMLLNKYPALTFQTIDEGRTEIKKGTLTTVAFLPMLKSYVPEEVKNLKLL